VALDLLARLYPSDCTRHVLARPGQLTAKLRRAWGLDDLKKDEQGNRRDDDRHHALDAIVVASTTESELQRLTRAAQEAERQGLPRGFDFDEVKPPAAGFRELVRDTVQNVFVSRAERRRARGEAHAATIKRVETIDGAPVVMERKAIEKLSLKDLDRIPTPEPYGKIVDPMKLRDATVAELRRWIEAGKPKDAPPIGPTGHTIRKVRVMTNDKVAVAVRGGTADRGDMVRVDVFSKPNKKGVTQYYLVPIYPHQIADFTNNPIPPNRAVIAYEDEGSWTLVDSNFSFKFSLYSNSLIEVTKADGETIKGYFKGLHRGTGALAIAPHADPRSIRGGIGAKTLAGFNKLKVDRLGKVTNVDREVRTWHGEACT
jgi:CRISPR-associated endonuclease Csn1